MALPPPPAAAAAPPPGMEECRRLSKRHSPGDATPTKLPGQIGFGPTHTGPAAQEATTPVATTRGAWPSSGTYLNRVALLARLGKPRSASGLKKSKHNEH
jgi:hypothetical protein